MSHQGRKGADEALLAALACGATVEAAARATGLSAATVHRRLRNAAFKERLHEAREQILVRVGGALTAASQQAVQTLLQLQKPESPAAVRLGAARAVLELALKARAQLELEVQIAELRQRIDELEGDAQP
jgi:hypothetical protein